MGAGFTAIWRYKLTPSAQGSVVARWPADTRLHAAPGRATLILFGHPQCPCTRATVAELARLMDRYGDRLDAWVLFATPSGAAKDFSRSDLSSIHKSDVWSTDNSDLWSSAERIPGVHVLRDEAGSEAARFGAATSGTIALYRDGKLLFHGGITPARGHEGDSFGKERLISLLTTGKADRDDAPVFGCSLSIDDKDRIARATPDERTQLR
ncbi:MAG TPA: RedB protein [Myxococcales bacterium]|jgi:hypothetical protein